MKNLFLKSLFVVGLSVACLSASATNLSTNVVAGGVFQLLSGPAVVTSFTVTAPVNNTTAFQVYDTSTNVLTNIVAAYTTTIKYATNLITTWTNYYGSTNSFTNNALVSGTVSVPTTTYLLPVRIAASVATNANITFDQVNIFFTSGALITNTGAGTLTFTATYQQ